MRVYLHIHAYRHTHTCIYIFIPWVAVSLQLIFRVWKVLIPTFLCPSFFFFGVAEFGVSYFAIFADVSDQHDLKMFI